MSFLELERNLIQMKIDDDDIDHDHLVAAERCINAFAAEVKHNKFIVAAELNLTGLSMDDLSEFIINNKALKTLRLGSDEPVSLQQSTVLSGAIQSAQLEEPYLTYCNYFENVEALSECWRGVQ